MSDDEGKYSPPPTRWGVFFTPRESPEAPPHRATYWATTPDEALRVFRAGTRADDWTVVEVRRLGGFR